MVNNPITFSLSKSLHQGVRELTFECDGVLRPYQVIAPGLDKWEVAPAAPHASAVVLNVHLSQPLEEGTVQILCLAPLSGREPFVWTSPAVRLRQSIPGGETINLTVHPDLRMTTLDPGAFRLKEAGTEPRGWPTAWRSAADLYRRRHIRVRRQPTRADLDREPRSIRMMSRSALVSLPGGASIPVDRL